MICRSVDYRDNQPATAARSGRPLFRPHSRYAYQITMRFSPQFLDELRARLPASEIVGKRVKLRKAGREWKGLVAIQQGEDAVVLRQRPEGDVV